MRHRLPLIALAVALLAAALASGAWTAQAGEGTLEAINAKRASASCFTGAAPPPLRASAALDRAAASLAAEPGADTKSLNEVLLAAGYRASKSMLLRVSGVAAGAALAQQLENSSCEALVSRDWRDIGMHYSGGSGRSRAWIILALPFSPPADADAADVAARVLALVNAARAQARDCGGRRFPAAPPLAWSARLAGTAMNHSADMAAHGYFSHEGRDGSSPAARTTRNGYAWRSVGENIAAGPTTADAVVRGWIASPPHCANLMGAQFTEMGVAFAVNPTSRMGIYWTQMFASPR